MTDQPQPAEPPTEPNSTAPGASLAPGTSESGEPPTEQDSTAPGGSFVPGTWEPGEPEGELEAVVDALRDVVDPELGVNIVDLGLVYSVQRDEAGNVTVDMTLTSPMCPLTDQLEYDTHYMLMSLAHTVTINWVWLPPWTLDNITDDGREQLRAIGYSL